MSNLNPTVALRSAKVSAPAVQDLDLNIVLINDTVVRLPFGSMRMHANAPRTVKTNAAQG